MDVEASSPESGQERFQGLGCMVCTVYADDRRKIGIDSLRGHRDEILIKKKGSNSNDFLNKESFWRCDQTKQTKLDWSIWDYAAYSERSTKSCLCRF